MHAMSAYIYFASLQDKPQLAPESLPVPEHEPLTRRKQFRVKSKIKQERQAKKGSGKGQAGKGKGKGKTTKEKGTKRKPKRQSKKGSPCKLKKIKKIAKSTRQPKPDPSDHNPAKIPSDASNMSSTPCPCPESDAPVAEQPAAVKANTVKKATGRRTKENKKQQQKPEQANTEQVPAKPEAQKKTAAKSKAAPKSEARKKKGTKTPLGSQDKPEQPDQVSVAALLPLQPPFLDPDLQKVADVLKDRDQATCMLVPMLTKILEVCAAHGTKPCDGMCHEWEFDIMPSSNIFQFSVYWNRRAVGVKVKDGMRQPRSSSNKFVQVNYFSSGPCIYANYVLALLWVTWFGNLCPNSLWINTVYLQTYIHI
jgi:hypothetical protein